MDPITAAFLGLSGGMLLGGAGGGGGTQTQEGFTPGDTFAVGQTILGPEGSREAELARLQQLLAGQLMGGGDMGLGGGLGLQSLTSGMLPSATLANIRQAAYGGLDESMRRASSQAESYAMAKGVPLSSMQFSMQNDLQRPLMAQAMQTEAQMRLAEVGRLQGLRQQEIQNRLAVQQSPALQRLSQLRLAEAIKQNLQMARHPGGLPQYAYPGSGESAWGGAYGPSGPTFEEQLTAAMNAGRALEDKMPDYVWRFADRRFS